MEVGSVSSSLNAAAQTQQAQQAQQTQQAQQAQQSQQEQKAPPVDEREALSGARDEAERPRPTVNTNGQTVGTRVNTTA